jgi:pimeloyl-ACP methyl ester carboxylesterase
MSDTSNELVYQVKEYGGVSDKVVFLFCPFGVPSWQMALPGLPIRRLTHRGYKVFAYSYGLPIITITPAITIENMRAILDDADKRINRLGSNQTIYCFGTSMGTVLAANFASHHTRVSKLVLNLCYVNIADHILHLPFMWLITPRKVKQYVAAGGGTHGLHKIFDPYSPDHLLDRLKGRDILLYTSRNDRILQYKDTKDLRKSMNKANIHVSYSVSRWLGHYLTALANHLRAKKYLQFLAGL